MLKIFAKPKKDLVTGPPYAVLNVSKIGLRYFRMFIKASRKSREKLATQLVNHPNVGWMLYAKGWFTMGIGFWAKDNAEINDISEQIRNVLTPQDEIVLQSELTSLYSFGDRSALKIDQPMCIVDSTINPVELSPIEIDFIKLQALDSSLEAEELQSILNLDAKRLEEIRVKLTKAGVIVGQQERVQYAGIHFKIFVDSLSRKKANAVDELVHKLWHDSNCIYFERANSKYDLEFEMVLAKKAEIKEYVKNFSDFKVAIPTKNLYINLYSINKVANFKEIQEIFLTQNDKVVDFRNSKLWYLNYAGVKAYLDIYAGSKKYFEILEQGEMNLFEEIAAYLRKQCPNDKFSVLDIGSGDGMKGRIFIEKLGEKLVKAYYPIDIQPIELATTAQVHSDGQYSKHPTLLNIENLATRFPLKMLPSERQVYIFFGATYGNFTHKTINAYLKPLLKNANSSLLIAMPIVTKPQNDQVIIDSYFSFQYENVAFGPLLQAGFKKEDFLENKEHLGFVMQIKIEDRCLVSEFILKRDMEIIGKIFKKGTIFKMVTSWKPTLAEFIEALETDFVVEKVFSSDKTAIALISQGKE